MKAPLIVAYGGGVNSTAMLVEMSRRGIKPDLILFADTGGERPETYKAVQTVSEWGVSHGFPAVVTVKKVDQNGDVLTLENDCITRKALPSIAYGFKTCSQKFKGQPQDKFCNSWGPAISAWSMGIKCVKAIGYDAGERHRLRQFEDPKYTLRFPLAEWEIDRDDCVEICKSEGLPTAKSSCFYCPSMKKREIFELAKTHPDLADRAIAMEENAELTSVNGLGRDFSWKWLLKNEQDQGKLFDFDSTTEIPCGCYDG